LAPIEKPPQSRAVIAKQQPTLLQRVTSGAKMPARLSLESRSIWPRYSYCLAAGNYRRLCPWTSA